MKKIIGSLALISVLGLLVLTLFPPWTTVMGSYPKVAYHWIFSPPQPISGSGDTTEYFEFRVDIIRLQIRYVFILTISIIGCGITYLVLRVRGAEEGFQHPQNE